MEENDNVDLQMRQNEEKGNVRFQNDSDDDWVWDFDMDEVIITCHACVKKKQRFGDICIVMTKDKPRQKLKTQLKKRQ